MLTRCDIRIAPVVAPPNTVKLPRKHAFAYIILWTAAYIIWPRSIILFIIG